ncbi:hypothetical protein [Mycobacterium intracellulare]|uniref:Uncharacterized protein n=3 Tax=Mycobacterium intracellulare TaxID=1767 RepID=A0ABT7P6U6_MYCIT|nr:hypothetical protein [Mycobacterium intracellulare]MCF1814182.1 hypothetical protein [Mycobacterium intracellulare subsp. intracellulare]MDM3928978.1 hypothetical protein [Mycobacterium intracellulare subsp. chimaera]
MGPGERHSELYLKLLVEQLHGVSLIQHDRGGLQGAVDYVFTSPSASGAVEMTTVQDGRAAAWASKLDELDESVTFDCPSPRGWTVVVDLGTRLDHLQRRLPSVINACDQYGVTSPAQLPVTAHDAADVRWFASTYNRLHPVDGRPGTVRVEMPSVFAFPRSDGLGEDLAKLLSSKAITTKLDKLRSHPGVSERHLAVGVSDIYAAGFDLLNDLAIDGRDLPEFEPPGGFGVTHLWFTSGGYLVLTWNRFNGWSWRQLPRPE